MTAAPGTKSHCGAIKNPVGAMVKSRPFVFLYDLWLRILYNTDLTIKSYTVEL